MYKWLHSLHPNPITIYLQAICWAFYRWMKEWEMETMSQCFQLTLIEHSQQESLYSVSTIFSVFLIQQFRWKSFQFSLAIKFIDFQWKFFLSIFEISHSQLRRKKGQNKKEKFSKRNLLLISWHKYDTKSYQAEWGSEWETVKILINI